MTDLNIITWNSTGETAEGGHGGRGYLMLTHKPVTITDAFRRLDLSRDQQLLDLIQTLAPRPRDIATDELKAMRMPAFAVLKSGKAPGGLPHMARPAGAWTVADRTHAEWRRRP